MYHEIERKFLVQHLPNLKGVSPILQERYFLQQTDLVEERIQKRGDMFEYEIKTMISSHEWRREKRFLTKQEFDSFKVNASLPVTRESYFLSKKSPRLSIKIYYGTYRGLTLAEVEFDSVKEAEDFEPYEWMGTEITRSPLGREAKLLDLDRDHFLQVLKTEKGKLNDFL